MEKILGVTVWKIKQKKKKKKPWNLHQITPINFIVWNAMRERETYLPEVKRGRSESVDHGSRAVLNWEWEWEWESESGFGE